MDEGAAGGSLCVNLLIMSKYDSRSFIEKEYSE